MLTRALSIPLLTLAAVLGLACGSRDTPSAPPAAAPVPAAPAPAPAAPAFDCGAALCARGELCEERFKGHSTDDEGRPLERKKCMSLPDACRRAPTCACVTQHLAATRCTDAGGQVRISDYPR